MRLRAQTLLAGAATLVVPLLGWQVVRELDASLLEGRVAAQELAAANLRAELAEAVSVDPGLADALALGTAPREGELYALGLDAPLVVDGYDEDWPMRARAGTGTDAGAGADGPRVRAAMHRGSLFLVVDVDDATPVWHRPPPPRPDAGELERPSPDELRANGDALELFVETPDGTRRHALLSPTAPGELPAVAGSDAPAPIAGGRAERAGRDLARWRAAWQARPGGWRVELRLPLPARGSRVGVAALDASEGADAPSGVRSWSGTLDPTLMRRLRRDAGASPPDAVPVLHRPEPGLRAVLEARVRPGTRGRLFDAAGRLLVDVDELNLPGTGEASAPGEPFASVWDALLFRVFAWLVAGDLPLPLERAPDAAPLHLAGATAAFDAAGPDGVDPSADPAVDPIDVPNGARPGGTRRYVSAERDRVIGTLERFGPPEASGWLLLESNEEHSAAYNGARLARLFSLLVLASAAATLVALGLSTRLSLRIRALSRDAGRAVDRDGRIDARTLPGMGSRDELGELSRDLAALLERSQGYTRYLEALSSRLSHELGTPLAVVRGALENIERGRLDAESATLVERAERGAGQLGELLRALVESTRLEGVLARAERVPVRLDAFASDCVERYAHAYPGVRTTLRRTFEPDPSETPAPPAPGDDPLTEPVTVAPEPLLQALDKLVDNAVDFALDDEVQLVLATLGARAADERPSGPAPGWAGDRARRRRRGGAALFLGVSNRGAPLGADVAARLFEPMYSARAGGAHLGLGLHVVRLVAELHGGRAMACEHGPWTTIGLVLPLEASEPVREAVPTVAPARGARAARGRAPA